MIQLAIESRAGAAGRPCRRRRSSRFSFLEGAGRLASGRTSKSSGLRQGLPGGLAPLIWTGRHRLLSRSMETSRAEVLRLG